MNKTIGKYVLTGKLNSGANFEVWEASYEETKSKCTLKFFTLTEIPEKNAQFLRFFDNQRRTLSRLKHPNIIILYEASDREVLRKENGEEVPVMYLATELATNGDLFDCVKRTGAFSEIQARYYFKVVVNVLEYIHSQGYAHCNLKLENLLLNSDYDLKVAGFGYSSLDVVSKPYTYISTCIYHPPEIYAGVPYSTVKVDLFALGVLLFIMVAGRAPFKRAEMSDIWYKLFCLSNNKFWMQIESRRKQAKFSNEFKDLINKLLSFKAEERPSIDELREHLWCKGLEMTLEEIRKKMIKKLQ
jgi:BR serine/threonine kinase